MGAKTMTTRASRILVGLVVGSVLLVSGCDDEPVVTGGPLSMRKLTEAQYRQSIADIFGEDILVVGRFESETRTDGLLAVGSSRASVTEAGIEQFYAMANSIASQVVDEDHRDDALSCPATDDACARAFFARTGRLIFRRTLSADELEQWVVRSTEAAETTNDFHDGIATALSGMLVSPEFLFRIDTAESDPDAVGETRLSGYSIASRLSFFLWNTTPDDELLTAAETGQLHSDDGLALQADRLLASPRLERGMRAFFRDFLGMEAFEHLQKDKLVYPAFNQAVTEAAEEQILRLVMHHLVASDGDYRDLFTTRDTFMNRPLGMVYAVPVRSPDGWEAFSFPEDDPRVGLLSHVGFTALHSHRGRSSATLRGIAIRELLMCQPVQPPPAAVDFTVVQDTDNPNLKTARERLTAHRTEPVCKGCHQFYDPIGLSLENFDGAGMYRSQENGAAIDISGDIDGTTFANIAELGAALREHPAITSCLVESVIKYAAGRESSVEEQGWVDGNVESFSANGHRLKPLLRDIVASDAFYAVATETASTNAKLDIQDTETNE